VSLNVTTEAIMRADLFKCDVGRFSGYGLWQL